MPELDRNHEPRLASSSGEISGSLTNVFESRGQDSACDVELQVGVELQAVAVRIAHVELTCAPAGVGDLGAIDNPPELLR